MKTRIFSTKYFGATDTKPGRIQVRGFDAFNSRRTGYEQYPHHADGGVSGAHEYAVKAVARQWGLGEAESHTMYDDPVDAVRYVHVVVFV